MKDMSRNRLNGRLLWRSSVRPAAAVLLLWVLASGSVAAQGPGRGRTWKRGLLRVEEFASMPTTAGRESSHLEYGLGCDYSGHDEGMHTYVYGRASALMYPTASWFADGHRNDAELSYNQTIFDLVEVHRRHLQHQGLVAKRRSQFDLLLRAEREQLDREVRALQLATDYGRDSATLERIRLANRQWLNDHPGGRPLFEPQRYWWMLGMEFGVDLSTGYINEVCSPSIGSSGYLYGFGWNRHGLYFRMFNAEVLSHDSVMDYDGQMRQIPLLRLDLQLLGYGYTLLDRDAYSVTPYVALGVTDIDWFAGTSYTLGVMGFWHFHHWHTIKDGARGKARRFTPSLMGNLYVSYTSFAPGDQGLTFGVHLGITFKSRRERVSWHNDEQ